MIWAWWFCLCYQSASLKSLNDLLRFCRNKHALSLNVSVGISQTQRAFIALGLEKVHRKRMASVHPCDWLWGLSRSLLPIGRNWSITGNLAWSLFPRWPFLLVLSLVHREFPPKEPWDLWALGLGNCSSISTFVCLQWVCSPWSWTSQYQSPYSGHFLTV